MDKKSFLGLLLAAVFCLITAVICACELMMALRNGSIEDPVNRGHELSRRMYRVVLLLYAAGAAAAGGLAVYLIVQMIKNPVVLI